MYSKGMLLNNTLKGDFIFKKKIIRIILQNVML